MTSIDDLLFGKRSKKQVKCDTLADNVRKGRAAEEQFVMQQRFMGREVERTGRGSDYRVRDVNPWTGERGRAKLVEVKSSHAAKESPLQKKSKAKKVVVEPLFY